MKELLMSNGGVSLVDDDVYEWARHSRWFKVKSRTGRTWYAQRNVKSPDGRFLKENLARLILGLSKGDPREADHKNGDGLNNTRENLRVSEHRQNVRNRGALDSNLTGYRGVSRNGVFFKAIFIHDEKRHRLGSYPDQHEAAYAINLAAHVIGDEFYRLNVIPEEFIPAPGRREVIRSKVAAALASKPWVVVRNDSRTGYRGVTERRENPGVFIARIGLGKEAGFKNAALGQYTSPHEAAHAYNVASKLLRPGTVAPNPIPKGAIDKIRAKEIERSVLKRHALHSAVQL